MRERAERSFGLGSLLKNRFDSEGVGFFRVQGFKPEAHPLETLRFDDAAIGRT